MQVEFRTRQLQRAYEDDRLAVRRWGAEAGRVFADWIDLIQ